MNNNNDYTWHPVFSNTYLVKGERRRVGAIGSSEAFEIKKISSSSHTAYIEVRDALYNNGYEHILVKTIKMICTYCGEAHVVIPPDLYL